MKVAQLATRYPPAPGGVEQHVAEIAPRLHARGHAVDVYTSELYREFPAMQRFGPEVPREERTSFGAVHRLPVWSFPGELHYTFFRGLIGALARDRPEVVHAHTYGTNQVAAANHHHRRFGTPFVLTAHFHPIWSIEGGWFRRRLRSFYDRSIAGGVVQGASRIIVQTHEEERLLRSLGLALPPLEIIPPGYRPLPPPGPGTPSFAEKYRIPGPFVLFVGRLASNKGLLDLAEAFAVVAKSDRSAQLVVVGEDGGQRAPLEARVKALGISDRVHLVGHVEGDALLSAAYREARLTVLPSEYEAFGLVLLESLAAGTPVVASRVGGIPEFVEDGKAGLLVPPKSPRELAAAISQVWSDRDLAHRLGEYGRDHVVPRYTWEGLVDRLDGLYREVTHR
ncbi:MAG: glycosyltransferase family 4 protein [Thermoplasmata archaeon]